MTSPPRPPGSRSLRPRPGAWLLAGALVLAIGCKGEEPVEVPEPAPAVCPEPERPPPIADISDLEHAFEKAAEVAAPSVVSITAEIRGQEVPLADMLGISPDTTRGLGSGVIVSADGYILTNNHVVEGATTLTVTLHDDRRIDAKLVGTDPHTDLAVIKIEAKDLSPATLGRSDPLRVGQFVIAIGSPFGLERTVTAGIISAKGRGRMGIVDYEDFLQTDAAINMGNSGGPLLDLQGRVVGINTAILSRTGGSQGVGLAIPIDMAREVMPQLIEKGRVVRGWLGIAFLELLPDAGEELGYEGAGVLVSGVLGGGPADQAGIARGDVLITLEGEPIEDGERFRRAIARLKPGEVVKLEILRGEERRTVELKVGERPAPAKDGR